VSPGHGPVHLLQRGGQPALQQVVDDQLGAVVVLLQAAQQEPFTQLGEQLPDDRQQRLKLRLTHHAASRLEEEEEEGKVVVEGRRRRSEKQKKRSEKKENKW